VHELAVADLMRPLTGARDAFQRFGDVEDPVPAEVALFVLPAGIGIGSGVQDGFFSLSDKAVPGHHVALGLLEEFFVLAVGSEPPFNSSHLGQNPKFEYRNSKPSFAKASEGQVNYLKCLLATSKLEERKVVSDFGFRASDLLFKLFPGCVFVVDCLDGIIYFIHYGLQAAKVIVAPGGELGSTLAGRLMKVEKKATQLMKSEIRISKSEINLKP